VTIADLVAADFIGYMISSTVVWGSPLNETDGTVTSVAPSHSFVCTTAGTPNAIANVGITDGATGLLGYAVITPAIEIVNPGDGIAVVIGWNEGVVSINSEAVLIV